MINYEDLPILESLATLLQKRGKTISTAESCTGGMIGMALTSLPGSSAYYMGGVISYSNDVKAKVISVSPDKLDKYGAVSHEVAEDMAKGVQQVIGTDYSIATTGIAGPGGGSEAKPVGLVYIGIGTPEGVRVYKHMFEGKRDEVRQETTLAGLTHLLYILQEEK